MTRYRRKFHKIARKLTNLELQRGAQDFSLSMEGVLRDLEESHGSRYFLGSYSESGIMLALDKFGITRELRRRGFNTLRIHLDTSDPYRQRLRLFFDRQDPEHLLGELIVHKAQFASKSRDLLPEECYPLSLLHVEWLVLQDPTRDFSPERPQLPGQEHPGLGVGSRVLEILYLVAKHQRTQGLLIVPHYYHTARLFSREFKFINPEYQALLNALIRDLGDHSLSLQAWAVESEAVRWRESGRRFQWHPEEQILPADPALKKHFVSEDYQAQVSACEQKFTFELDREHLAQVLPSYLATELEDEK